MLWVDWFLFSAYAEVFPGSFLRGRLSPTFLCLRRGVSPITTPTGGVVPFSLPTQRCFFHRGVRGLNLSLFSAYAEVFLASSIGPKRKEHFSLPTQRCFSLNPPLPVTQKLFSAYAEVFPGQPACARSLPAFLCLRRGVSQNELRREGVYCFSLPTQRCFSDCFSEIDRIYLFSAYAEVFLCKGRCAC